MSKKVKSKCTNGRCKNKPIWKAKNKRVKETRYQHIYDSCLHKIYAPHVAEALDNYDYKE